MALILAMPRRLTEGERILRAGKWIGWSPTSMLGHRVSGKRLGIVGIGRIGRAVARRAHASDEYPLSQPSPRPSGRGDGASRRRTTKGSTRCSHAPTSSQYTARIRPHFSPAVSTPVEAAPAARLHRRYLAWRDCRVKSRWFACCADPRSQVQASMFTRTSPQSIPSCWRSRPCASAAHRFGDA